VAGIFGLLFRLLVLGRLFAPLAILFELDFFLNRFAVLAAPIIDALAGRAGQLD
jgi:hypothetical protein